MNQVENLRKMLTVRELPGRPGSARMVCEVHFRSEIGLDTRYLSAAGRKDAEACVKEMLLRRIYGDCVSEFEGLLYQLLSHVMPVGGDSDEFKAAVTNLRGWAKVNAIKPPEVRGVTCPGCGMFYPGDTESRHTSCNCPR